MSEKSKKYYIKIFGCQMNLSDSERIAGWYEANGWERARTIEEADEVVIVTCSVRQSAENRVFGLVNNLIKFKSQKAKVKNTSKKSKVLEPRIILTGCMLRYPKGWLEKKLPGVDEFKNIREFKVKSSKCKVRESKTMAYIPIMEGCNNFCTYCVVPYARGREVSRPFDEVVCEVEELARRGYKEITLLGQNVNSYQPSFAKLLRTLHEISGIEKISFITSNPWDLTDEIIEAISLPKIDRYLHLPVQSGDDEILKKMNRPYTVVQYIKLIEKIRKKIPDIKIGTDIIVGFPAETEEQFEHTVKLAKKIGFEKAYIAMYSPREQTAAFKMEDNVPYKEKKRRWQVLEDLINSKIGKG
jgi:tRNA-2-methylthio-N6-dimethylallyladenosine synthase